MPAWVATLWKGFFVIEVLAFWRIAWDMAAFAVDGAVAPVVEISAEVEIGPRAGGSFPVHRTLYRVGAVVRAGYRYQVGGRLHQGKQIWIGGNFTSPEHARQFVQAAEAGLVRQVLYRKSSPETAVIRPYPNAQVVLERLIVPLILVSTITTLAYVRSRRSGASHPVR